MFGGLIVYVCIAGQQGTSGVIGYNLNAIRLLGDMAH